ncbi:olfactory receptor 2AT4-like [Hyperolius riggenbachi]|uniref:olfactory receptor 2AT4-like n=1 Tax=Hyperolius riggenbachi TaxID=752182 RepID=UPI0035A38F61
MANQTEIYQFILVGFPGLPETFNAVVSIPFLLLYKVSLCANGAVVILVSSSRNLHQPMYIIIASLAISDLLFDTTVLPKVLSKYWFGDDAMSYYGCFFQMTIIHTCNPLDSLIIMLMAVDRYIAICKPLRYHSIVSSRATIIVCCMLYYMAVVIGICVMSLANQLPYNNINKVKNLFFAIGTTAVTARIDVTPVLVKAYCIGLACHLGPLSFIIFSYCIILTHVCSSSHSKSWKKALSTCVTHWFVIAVYNIPRLTVYTYDQLQTKPNGDVYIFLVCLYTFVPHVSSPIIFCFRNEEIKTTIVKVFKKTNTQ